MSQPRNISKQVRFNAEELLKLDAVSAAYGINYSNLIRHLIEQEYSRLQQPALEAGGEFRPHGQRYVGVRMRPSATTEGS
jgi:capsid protein